MTENIEGEKTMAVREGEYLLLQQGQKQFMLLRSGSKFHLFTVDKRFTEEREEKLMQLYPCSEETLRELGFTFTAWYVRGVAAGGCDAGETLILYVGKKKYRYTLADDYTQEQMGGFFEGIEKYPMPKKKYKPSDWRLEKQQKELIPLMKGIKYVLLVLSLFPEMETNGMKLDRVDYLGFHKCFPKNLQSC